MRNFQGIVSYEQKHKRRFLTCFKKRHHVIFIGFDYYAEVLLIWAYFKMQDYSKDM